MYPNSDQIYLLMHSFKLEWGFDEGTDSSFLNLKQGV